MSLTLVTGVPGWLGTQLVKGLLEGIPGMPSALELTGSRRIRCLVMPGENIPVFPVPDKVEVVMGDLRDPDALKAFCRNSEGSALFHCAGIVHPKRFTREFFRVNVNGTRSLLQQAEEARIRRAVVVSSNSPFGANLRRDHRFTEESPYNPYMRYGCSKMMMEEVVKAYQEKGRLETVIVRPTWFYGPNQPERQTVFFRMIRHGYAPIVGDGENLRSLVYIDNLCQALLLCERAAVANGQAYWVSDSRPYSMNEIVTTIERLMEREFGLAVAHKRLRLPFLVSEVAWLADKLIQGLGFYQQKIHVLSEMNKTIACSIKKACDELGYAPTIDLEEGMRRSLAWCMKAGVEL